MKRFNWLYEKTGVINKIIFVYCGKDISKKESIRDIIIDFGGIDVCTECIHSVSTECLSINTDSRSDKIYLEQNFNRYYIMDYDVFMEHLSTGYIWCVENKYSIKNLELERLKKYNKIQQNDFFPIY